MKRNFDIGFSPCPNDTFIFDALVNEKIDTGKYSFTPVMEDVETLNKWALEKKLPVTKLSYGSMAPVLADYYLLNSGSALGKGVGPLLIGLPGSNQEMLKDMTVAIPGEHTTAHVLFGLKYPEVKQKIFVRYNEVEQFVLEGRGLGVIIHENRFTYESKGLVKLSDLGEAWEKRTSVPIPLGGIVAQKYLGDIAKEISELIRRSIEYAWQQYPHLPPFITEHAMEMNETVMRQHINLYVNDFSLDLGDEGKQAVYEFLRVYGSIHPGNYAVPEFA